MIEIVVHYQDNDKKVYTVESLADAVDCYIRGVRKPFMSGAGLEPPIVSPVGRKQSQVWLLPRPPWQPFTKTVNMSELLKRPGENTRGFTA